jgi:transposase
VDLRERVVAAFDVGDMTDEEVAALFKVGEATVHRWKRLKRETGSVVPTPPRGGKPPRTAAPATEHHELVRAIMTEEPDLTIPESALGVPVSPSAMGRTLRKSASREKESLSATEQSELRIQELRRFLELAKTPDPRRLVFVDEAGSHTGMTRDYARAPRRERAHGHVPRNRGDHARCARRPRRAGDDDHQGRERRRVFETFLVRVLLPKLRHGDIVVLDNVGAH